MNSQLLSKPLPYIALILANLIWAVNFVVAKITLQEIPPMSLAFLRFAFAVILIAPFFIAQTKKTKIQMQDFPKLISMGILIITLNIAFFFEGIARSTVINASVLTLIIPIFSVLVGWIFLREKVYLVNLFGAVVGFIGALVIIRVPQFFLGTYSPTELVGNILIILASLCWVAGSVISKEMLEKYSSLVVTTIAFLVGVVTFFLPAVNEYLQDPSWVNQVSTLGVLGLVYMILLSSISAYFLFEWGLSKVGVYRANLLHYIEPFIAAGLGVWILQEQITPPFLFGSVLIILGVYLGTLTKSHHKELHKTNRT